MSIRTFARGRDRELRTLGARRRAVLVGVHPVWPLFSNVAGEGPFVCGRWFRAGLELAHASEGRLESPACLERHDGLGRERRPLLRLLQNGCRLAAAQHARAERQPATTTPRQRVRPAQHLARSAWAAVQRAVGCGMRAVHRVRPRARRGTQQARPVRCAQHVGPRARRCAKDVVAAAGRMAWLLAPCAEALHVLRRRRWHLRLLGLAAHTRRREVEALLSGLCCISCQLVILQARNAAMR
eukprot:5698067-Pleurochrysis_carterae.AAC.1